MALFTSGVKINPANVKLRNNLGMELKSAGRLEEAQHQYKAGFYTRFFCQGEGEIRFYVYMYFSTCIYSLLFFPLVLLLSFIWQWFSKCKK